MSSHEPSPPHLSPALVPQHTILQEFIYLRGGPTLAYRVEHIPLPAGVAPDAHVRQHLNWERKHPDHAILHSTSWRYDLDSASLILTWVIIPDPHPLYPAIPITVSTRALPSTDASYPVPDNLMLDDVIRHAARHLAFLSHNDPAVSTALHGHRDLHDQLLPFAPNIAGQYPHNHQTPPED